MVTLCKDIKLPRSLNTNGYADENNFFYNATVKLPMTANVFITENFTYSLYKRAMTQFMKCVKIVLIPPTINL